MLNENCSRDRSLVLFVVWMTVALCCTVWSYIVHIGTGTSTEWEKQTWEMWPGEMLWWSQHHSYRTINKYRVTVRVPGTVLYYHGQKQWGKIEKRKWRAKKGKTFCDTINDWLLLSDWRVSHPYGGWIQGSKIKVGVWYHTVCPLSVLADNVRESQIWVWFVGDQGMITVYLVLIPGFHLI